MHYFLISSFFVSFFLFTISLFHSLHLHHALSKYVHLSRTYHLPRNHRFYISWFFELVTYHLPRNHRFYISWLFELVSLSFSNWPIRSFKSLIVSICFLLVVSNTHLFSQEYQICIEVLCAGLSSLPSRELFLFFYLFFYFILQYATFRYGGWPGSPHRH